MYSIKRFPKKENERSLRVAVMIYPHENLQKGGYRGMKKLIASLALALTLTLSVSGVTFAADSQSTSDNAATEAQKEAEAKESLNQQYKAAMDQEKAAEEAAAAAAAAAAAQQQQIPAVNPSAPVDANTQAQLTSLASGVDATTTVNGQPVRATAAPVSAAVAAQMSNAVSTMVPGGSVAKVFDLTLPAGVTIPPGGLTIRMSVPNVRAGQRVAVFHMGHNGQIDMRPVNSVGNGYVDANFTELSPVAIVVMGSSPKTGESLPILPIAGVLCMVGAAVCVTKRFV